MFTICDRETTTVVVVESVSVCNRWSCKMRCAARTPRTKLLLAEPAIMTDYGQPVSTYKAGPIASRATGSLDLVVCASISISKCVAAVPW